MIKNFKILKILALVIITINFSACSSVGDCYKTHWYSLSSEEYPLTPKAFDKLIHPSKIINEQNSAAKNISNAIVIYPLMVPVAMIIDVFGVVSYPFAPLFCWLAVEKTTRRPASGQPVNVLN